jgi:lysophospholipase L1-like esterase
VGDSLTAGTGGTGPGTKWQALLAQARLPWSPVANTGIGGQTSTQIRNRMVADLYHKDWTTVMWVGRNNITNAKIVMDDIAAMVATLTHNRFVVMSVLNNNDGSENPGSLAYNQIIALNQMIAAKYPNNYLDIRSLLVAASGGSNDHVNPTWAYDTIHLNNTGYAYVASQLDAFLRAKQWF